jgi:hypothetical protein
MRYHLAEWGHARVRSVWYCEGNLTILKRILYLDLAKGNPK